MASSVEDKVKQIIVEQLGVDESEVTPTASFIDDLGADSLDTVELVMGLVTALATGTEENWKALCEGRSGVTAITRFDTTLFTAKIAAEVKNFEPLNWFDKKDLKKMDAFIHY